MVNCDNQVSFANLSSIFVSHFFLFSSDTVFTMARFIHYETAADLGGIEKWEEWDSGKTRKYVRIISKKMHGVRLFEFKGSEDTSFLVVSESIR